MLPKLKRQAFKFRAKSIDHRVQTRNKTFIYFAAAIFILLFALSSFAENVDYVYDDLNRLKSIAYDDGTMIVYLYDEVGNRLSATTEIDSDLDGMPDDWEVTYGLNPTMNDAGGDKDNDGLTNLREYQLGTNPVVADTDGDRLSDSWEVNNNLDPNNQDTDGDWMPDGWEVAMD